MHDLDVVILLTAILRCIIYAFGTFYAYRRRRIIAVLAFATAFSTTAVFGYQRAGGAVASSLVDTANTVTTACAGLLVLAYILADPATRPSWLHLN